MSNEKNNANMPIPSKDGNTYMYTINVYYGGQTKPAGKKVDASIGMLKLEIMTWLKAISGPVTLGNVIRAMPDQIHPVETVTAVYTLLDDGKIVTDAADGVLNSESIISLS